MHDEYFPGFNYVVQQLSSLKDYQLVWYYVDWAMVKDQLKAVEIFTKRPSDEIVSERMRVDTIIDNLQNYKEALVVYLEYLIFNKNIKVLFLKPFLIQKRRSFILFIN